MGLLYLTLIILGCAGQNAVKKAFTVRFEEKGVYFFSTVSSIAALLFFLCNTRQLRFDPDLILYAIGFAVSYSVGTIFSVRAVACGSLTVTSLVISYSLMIPTFYGLLFLKDPVGTGLLPGIILLMISLLLINKPDKGVKISFAWIICVLLAFLGNGMCSVVQKMQQVAFDGAYKNEFMITALSLVTVAMLAMTLKTERCHLKACVKKGWHLPLICGALNGMVNLLVMVLSGQMPVSVMFPSISAGGLIVTYLISRFAYREKLTRLQFFGFILGIVSVIILNI